MAKKTAVKPEKNNTILIRTMSELEVKAMEAYKTEHSIKTNSKAVLEMVVNFQNKVDLTEAQRIKIADLESELSSLKADVRQYLNGVYLLQRHAETI